VDNAGFRDAARAQESFLAPLEKRALVWLARRLPGWVHSDHLTLAGFLAMAGAGASYWLAHYDRRFLLAGIVCLAVNWLGDSLDGTVARVRNRLRPRYGFYVDHITDAFGTFFLLAGLALSPHMSAWIAAGLLIAYFMLSIEVYLATYSLGTFQLSFWKFSPTELRALLMAGNIALFYRPVVRPFGKQYLLFDIGGLCGIVGIAAMLIVTAVRHTIILYRAETPRDSAGHVGSRPAGNPTRRSIPSAPQAASH
jgi:phosphatidylglycerophosphate synthase